MATNKNRFHKIRTLLLLVIVVFIFSCKKKSKTFQDNIAYQTVNVTIYPGDPLYFKLQSIGGWVYYNSAGVDGIIIYRKTQNTASDFVAIERASTYLPDNPYAAVKVQTDNFTLRDTISGSKWQIIDGALLSGPASTNLRLYNTNYDSGTGALTIRN